MTGYNNSRKHNQDVLAIFEPFGLFDTTHYLYIDAYKGTMIVYFHWWGDSIDGFPEIISELDAYGTREIIKLLLKKLVIDVDINKFRRRQ
jgi:hypothetical protein